MLRILSDLHLYDAATRVRDLTQLEPLLAGVRTLVINGDSCDTCHGTTPAQVAALQRFFRERVPDVIFITGNHDPDISDTHELMLAGGRLWLAHGDVCFDDIAPWSRNQPELWRHVQQQLQANPSADYREIAIRHRIARAAARAVGREFNPSEIAFSAKLARTWRTFFPPRQPLAMLRAWRELPARAAALAVAQRPSARLVVTGHIHYPGVWTTPTGPTVVNTGSFCRPLGGCAVDLLDDVVQVRRIVARDGQFHPGRAVAEIPLAATPAAALSASA
ncbi:MAG TPA: metallophosphoesterase [Opitutaceae bacterium]